MRAVWSFDGCVAAANWGRRRYRFRRRGWARSQISAANGRRTRTVAKGRDNDARRRNSVVVRRHDDDGMSMRDDARGELGDARGELGGAGVAVLSVTLRSITGTG